MCAMAWWADMPETARKWLGLAGVLCSLAGSTFLLGAVTVRKFDTAADLPASVQSVERRVDALEGNMSALTADVAEVRCIVRAQALADDPRDCLPIFSAGGGK